MLAVFLLKLCGVEPNGDRFLKNMETGISPTNGLLAGVKMVKYLISFLPSFLQVPLRRLMGAKIGKQSTIRFGTIFLADEIDIGENSQIGPFSIIRAHKVTIGNHCNIKPFCILSANAIALQNYVHIAPLAFIFGPQIQGADFIVGEHSRIFPFCWLDPGEGIIIGRDVCVGGHTLIFTHGVWANYIHGGPVSFGPVKIEDYVWLQWRVFVLPNVTIGHNSIIAANSAVTRSIPANCLAGGSPAKLIHENFIREPTVEEKMVRAQFMLSEFGIFQKRIDNSFEFTSFRNAILFHGRLFSTEYCQELKRGDLFVMVHPSLLSVQQKTEAEKAGINIADLFENSIYIYSTNEDIEKFISFARRFGIRFTVMMG
jgi:acetyltransferase-like isoleucine patch superfamily enzyme